MAIKINKMAAGLAEEVQLHDISVNIIICNFASFVFGLNNRNGLQLY
jgi:hypothetical protein